MSAAQKKVIDDHCTTEWAEKVAAPWADFEFAGRAKLAGQPGHEVYKLTPEQLDAWRKAVGARRGAVGRGRQEGGPGPEGGDGLAQGQPGEVQVGALSERGR